jgi:histone-lysine N-methyltransferase SETD3
MAAPFLASLRAAGGTRSRFAAWLAAAPDFTAPPKLSLQRYAGMGVGLAAAAPLSAGETVLRVPRSVWHPFSAEHALSQARAKAPPFVARVEEVAAAMAAQGIAGAAKLVSACALSVCALALSLTQATAQPLHVALALHLLFELGNPGAAGHAYVATLPTPASPALWPAEALSALAGTRTHAAAAQRRAFVATLHAALFGAGGGGIPRERFSWALAVILSRALSGEAAPYTLVPVLDALNHSAHPTCACVSACVRVCCVAACVAALTRVVSRARRHSFDAAAQEFVVTALRAHAPGEQLRIAYGPRMCNDRLLRLYGKA